MAQDLHHTIEINERELESIKREGMVLDYTAEQNFYVGGTLNILDEVKPTKQFTLKAEGTGRFDIGVLTYLTTRILY